MNYDFLKPILAQAARDGLRTLGTALMSYGVIKDGAGLNAFIGAGMTLAGILWGWWTTSGQLQAEALLKKMTASHSTVEAVEKAQALPAADATAVNKAIVQNVTTQKVAGVLLVAFALSFLMAGDARAQLKTPAQIQQDINNAFKKQNAAAEKVINGTSTSPDISCDFKIFIGLSPTNFEAVIKKCLSDVNSTIVADTQRALDSANAYLPNPDKDAVNCLGPGLAFLKAGVQVQGKPAVDAVAATATTPAIPAQAAVPPQDPGLVLLFQKYREFVLSGALTSCQAWINTPINASIASGIGGAAALTGAAAILVPKP
jgi:hypothetical protein